MSVKSQQANMKVIHDLVSQDLSYIHGERESGPNGAKKEFHTKSAVFLRALAKDLDFKESNVTKNYGGIAVSGEITLMGMWGKGNGLYFQLEQPIQPFNAFLYRAIKGMNDYIGDQNRWLTCELFESGNYKQLIDELMELRKPIKVAEAVHLVA